MADVAILDMDIRSAERGAPGDRIDLYDLTRADLGRYRVLVVPGMADQEHLARHRDVIHRYLDGGGVLLFCGQIHRDWLPGASRFVALDPPSLRSYRVAELAPHPIFDGVEPDDLTFRRGVAGFFARGHHPPPPGAEVLARLAGGEPATYLDRVSTRGTIVVHANGDLLGYGGQTDSTAARLPGQFLDWARGESGRRPADRADTGAPADHGEPGPGPDTGTGSGLAAVYGGSAPHHRALTMPKYARHLTGGLLYLPGLADTDLTGYDGVVLPERMHRGLLTAAAPRLRELLEAGGAVVAFAGGEPLPDFLPGVRFDPRPTNYWWWLEPGADLGLTSPSPDHALFDHLSLRDCTWHYHGALTPPDGADTLVALPTGEALLYVDRVSTPGTLVVATLDPLSHYGGHFMPATERFLDGFLPWLGGAVVRSTR
ncbi:hypothetical protein [Pseudonocardia sp.]|uniref:hypothetical protein n=1 Tax=Pseudonocardia sp. TaxID=60912 RepID=UPI00262A3F22|nr:hypothetical protein [Pseudonocardia sp.]